jgi:hypothetical protein
MERGEGCLLLLVWQRPVRASMHKGVKGKDASFLCVIARQHLSTRRRHATNSLFLYCLV